jgi:transcriptional regulator with XRE-family HTH domain
MLIFERRNEMDYPVIDIEGTGAHIRDLIRESGHSVIEVSEYLGTSTSLVYRYIRGEVLPSIDRIVALSVYLGVPIEQIIAVA